ncbi:hypothetical protein RhiirA4_397190 [Rhizophagus irregularis]|uniref:Uncharacterized protein n=1 Tax=Rhizophagus irregularis TaxID=588596 RepID=A0A2I1G6M4_9GLOM|nr:hypothetical protein RhiirA4_397190 [Rhizophagus irregularis]
MESVDSQHYIETEKFKTFDAEHINIGYLSLYTSLSPDSTWPTDSLFRLFKYFLDFSFITVFLFFFFEGVRQHARSIL